MSRPNILWICTDQQRWDTIGALGFPGIRTPHIDSLAEQGVAFENAYAQSPICTPSRASFLTGMYPSAHQVHRNGNSHFPDHLALVPRHFQQSGWTTGLVGKLHLSAAQHREEQRPDDGYDEFYWSHYPYPEKDAPAEAVAAHDYHGWLREKGIDPEVAFAYAAEALADGIPVAHHQTTWARERAERFMDAHKDPDTPWFLSINLFDPHPPFDPPRTHLDRIDADAVPMPAFRDTDLAHHERFSEVDQQTTVPVDPRKCPEDGSAVSVPEGRESHDTPPDCYDVRRIRAAYFAMIELVDDMVGSLLATLDSTGQRRDTLVLFMSDHGEMLGDHGLMYKGCRFYEGLVHVPLLASWPGHTPAGTSTALVELVDLPATLCEAAELPPMVQDQGRSLWPLLTDRASRGHHKSRVLSEFWDAIGFPGARGSRGTMYFDGRYKLCLYHDVGEGELFDLRDDPDEHDDLWPDPAHAELRATLVLRHFAEMMLATGIGPARVAAF